MFKQTDLVNGPLGRKILAMAIPLALIGIVQQLFTTADCAIIGRYGSEEALSAVGCTVSAINLFINVFTGFALGVNVIMAQKLGANDTQAAQRTMHSALLLSVVIGFGLALAGWYVSPMLASAMGTPAELEDLSILYMRVYCLGSPVMMLYNCASGIFRAKGEALRPLFCLLISGVINVFLNILFVVRFDLGVAGVALSTVLSNAFGAFFLIWLLVREQGALHFCFTDLHIDRENTVKIIKIAVPAAIQGMAFSMSNMLIQIALNRMGTSAIAASSIALNFELIVFYILNGFAHTSVTFNGQNYGARKYDRCRHSSRLCVLIGMVFVVIIVSVLLILKDQLSSLFVTDEATIKLIGIRMAAVLPFECVNLFIEVLSGSMRGLGESKLPAIISIAGVCGTRLIWVAKVMHLNPTYIKLISVYPVSWCITSAAITLAYFISSRRIIDRAKKQSSISA